MNNPEQYIGRTYRENVGQNFVKFYKIRDYDRMDNRFNCEYICITDVGEGNKRLDYSATYLIRDVTMDRLAQRGQEIDEVLFRAARNEIIQLNDALKQLA